MEYNLTDKQRTVLIRLVEAYRSGELEDEFSVLWFLGASEGRGTAARYAGKKAKVVTRSWWCWVRSRVP